MVNGSNELFTRLGYNSSTIRPWDEKIWGLSSFMRLLAFSKLGLMLIVLSAGMLFHTVSASASSLSQRDWMITMVDTLGWSFGLPDEPQDPDYINILAGNRSYRFEAENIFTRQKNKISVLSFTNFGFYSGQGWLHGDRQPSEILLNFNLPLGGQYQVKANIRQAGHVFNIGEETIKVGGGIEFSEVVIGSYDLDAGPQEIKVTLPPNGSIDYISLTAPDFAIIAPSDGWQPDAELTWDVIETTLLQLYHLADFFPQSDEPIVIEAEDFVQEGFKSVRIPHLGKPSGGEWLMADPWAAEIRIPFILPQEGFYDLNLRVIGPEMTLTIGDHHQINFKGKAYLEDFVFPSLYFPSKNSDISVSLPPEGGIDRFSLTRRIVEPESVKTLLGFRHDSPPTPKDLNNIALLLAAFGAIR